MLEKEFKYFVDHQKELVKQYNGKYLVIKDQTVVGVYDTIEAAYEDAKEKYELGTFLIQHCIPGDAAFKQVFNSRVVFS